MNAEPVASQRRPWQWQGGERPQLARPEEVRALLGLFWPDLIEIEGYIFLADGVTPAALEKWKASDHFKLHGMRGVASALNHRHVTDLLGRVAMSMSETELAEIGKAIGQCWSARLAAAYPDRQFAFRLGQEIWFWEGDPPGTQGDDAQA